MRRKEAKQSTMTSRETLTGKIDALSSSKFWTTEICSFHWVAKKGDRRTWWPLAIKNDIGEICFCLAARVVKQSLCKATEKRDTIVPVVDLGHFLPIMSKKAEQRSSITNPMHGHLLEVLGTINQGQLLTFHANELIDPNCKSFLDPSHTRKKIPHYLL